MVAEREISVTVLVREFLTDLCEAKSDFESRKRPESEVLPLSKDLVLRIAWRGSKLTIAMRFVDTANYGTSGLLGSTPSFGGVGIQ
jgi:hypothetical protein